MNNGDVKFPNRIHIQCGVGRILVHSANKAGNRQGRIEQTPNVRNKTRCNEPRLLFFHHGIHIVSTHHFKVVMACI